MPLGRFLWREVAEAHDGEAITGFSKVGGGAIKDDLSCTWLSRNEVGLKPIAIGHVATENPLVGHHPCLIHQIFGDGHASLVIHARICHGGQMQF